MIQKNVADGVHRVADAYVNWYLVEEDGRFTVVDTGHPSSWGSLEEALRSLGRGPGAVDAVVLTHGHFDHVGFARRAHEELGVPVHAHEREVELVRDPWSYEHERSRLRYLANPRFTVVFLRMAAAGALWVKGPEEITTFDGEGELDVPGRPRVVPTPGHSHGHCSLHLPERGVLIAGDAVVTWNPYTASEGPQIVSGGATADSALALASLDAIAATGADTVLTGHGEPWTRGAEKAADAARAAGPS